MQKGIPNRIREKDLNAKDLARKALIMNRVLDGNLEMHDLKIQSLVPEEMRSLSREDFWLI